VDVPFSGLTHETKYIEDLTNMLTEVQGDREGVLGVLQYVKSSLTGI